MSRTIFTRSTVLAAAAMLALSACGGADEAPADQERDAGSTTATEGEAPQDDADEDADTDTDTDTTESDAAEDSSDDATEDSEEGGDTSAAEAAAVEIGTEFTDEETGDVITVVSATRHNPTEYYMASDNPDGEMIYLEVAVAPGDTYGGVLTERDFYLEDGGDEVNYAASADDELIDAGYEYFDGAPRREGEATGYIPIYIESTGDTIKGAYVRPEMKILGEDATVPEFRAEFEIPAA
ncbi:MAG: hypothetical protein L0H39_00805 [Brachybacterium sp.]|nr:hypothetical protein [Brachybacterium sp.]